MSKGFTIIEILVVMSLVVGMVAAGVMNFGRVRRQEDLQEIALNVVRLVEAGRNKAITGEGDKEWKVVVGASSVSLRDASNQIVDNYNLKSGYEIGGVGELTFARVNGLVEECASECVLTVAEIGGNLTYEIKVLHSGGVEY